MGAPGVHRRLQQSRSWFTTSRTPPPTKTVEVANISVHVSSPCSPSRPPVSASPSSRCISACHRLLGVLSHVMMLLGCKRLRPPFHFQPVWPKLEKIDVGAACEPNTFLDWKRLTDLGSVSGDVQARRPFSSLDT
ncbi:unnamed protein product [Pleuronectes platessa]|uniref:Uncharacterized protein n=1 Tax=Pleuronectes platessa TaxID=8262 RepID=A0A9N7UTZ3_PLEPL|nr:unnamed protein product [Pleuronectes platessa]